MTGSAVAVEALRILWVDDDSDWVDGFGGELREEGGHVVRLVGSIREAERHLMNHAFDLLILDQKIGSADTGGTTLVGLLKEGAFGELNQHAQFLFFTGSDEWVKTADVDVEALDGFLGIEEKGEVFSDFIDRYLARVIPNPHETDNTKGRDPEPPSAPGPSSVRTESWHGTITAVSRASFHARLIATDKAASEYDAEIGISRLTDAAREDLAIGATLALHIEAHDDGHCRTVRSELTLFPPPYIDKAELAEALAQARQRRGET